LTVHNSSSRFLFPWHRACSASPYLPRPCKVAPCFETGCMDTLDTSGSACLSVWHPCGPNTCAQCLAAAAETPFLDDSEWQKILRSSASKRVPKKRQIPVSCLNWDFHVNLFFFSSPPPWPLGHSDYLLWALLCTVTDRIRTCAGNA
jgi:hypothetical protein